MPDYHPEEEGAKPGGRSIEPQLFDINQLGEWKDKIRPNAMPFMAAVTCEELWGGVQGQHQSGQPSPSN